MILGLALAVPLAGWTARRGAGEALRRLGLLLIPEERQVPAVLERANALFREWRDLPAAPAEAVRHLAGDPVLAEAHRRMLRRHVARGWTRSIPLCCWAWRGWRKRNGWRRCFRPCPGRKRPPCLATPAGWTCCWP